MVKQISHAALYSTVATFTIRMITFGRAVLFAHEKVNISACLKLDVCCAFHSVKTYLRVYNVYLPSYKSDKVVKHSFPSTVITTLMHIPIKLYTAVTITDTSISKISSY
jgi:hypothetical protein